MLNAANAIRKTYDLLSDGSDNTPERRVAEHLHQDICIMRVQLLELRDSVLVLKDAIRYLEQVHRYEPIKEGSDEDYEKGPQDQEL